MSQRRESCHSSFLLYWIPQLDNGTHVSDSDLCSICWCKCRSLLEIPSKTSPETTSYQLSRHPTVKLTHESSHHGLSVTDCSSSWPKKDSLQWGRSLCWATQLVCDGLPCRNTVALRNPSGWIFRIWAEKQIGSTVTGQSPAETAWDVGYGNSPGSAGKPLSLLLWRACPTHFGFRPHLPLCICCRRLWEF